MNELSVHFPWRLAVPYVETEVNRDRFDTVFHPSHYQTPLKEVEVIDILEAFYPDNGRMWNVLKYLLRARKKGKYLQDLEKARFYLNREIDIERIKDETSA